MMVMNDNEIATVVLPRNGFIPKHPSEELTILTTHQRVGSGGCVL
jgi:hypothetical protein